MGNFRFVFESSGGHGCERDRGDGESVQGCGLFGCPDCEARRFVATMASFGMTAGKATFTHWPGQPDEVTDDLRTKVRKGSFPEVEANRERKLVGMAQDLCAEIERLPASEAATTLSVNASDLARAIRGHAEVLRAQRAGV